MNRRGQDSAFGQTLLLILAILSIILLTVFAYKYIFVPGTNPIPGENILACQGGLCKEVCGVGERELPNEGCAEPQICCIASGAGVQA